jgi:alpha-L-fucosidase
MTMIIRKKFGLAVLLTAIIHVAMATEQPEPYRNETPAQRDARMAWWREARFGMFIHWGLYAVPAGEWRGQSVLGNGEWIMNKAQISVTDYAVLTNQFNPVKFNADSWVALAKAAGMKYLIITAKHHEGFALFQSSASSFNVMDATPFKRDPLKELAAACSRAGIKLGFYYSQSQDWHHPGGAGNSWDPSQQGDYDHYLDTVAVPQVKELLSNYGPIAVLWYDTPRRMTKERADKFLALHPLQPGLIFNNRLLTADPTGGTMMGDTETPEQFIPPTGYPGKDWETCMTMNDTWGFKKNDQNWKSTETLLHNLSDIASKGGNFLLNVGPTAAGEIPEASITRLQAIGVWLKENGEAIYGTQAGPFPRRLAWGRTTQKSHADGSVTLYLHIWDWPADGKIVLPGLHDIPASGRMLTDGKMVTASDSAAGLVVHLPPTAMNSPITVAALEFSGPVTTSETMTTVGADGRILLPASEAELAGDDDQKPTVVGTGEMAVLNVRSHWQAIYSFTTPAEQVWTISAEVSPAAYNRLTVSAPGPFGRSLTTALQAWGKGPGSFTTVELGIMRLPAGLNTLVLKSEMDDLRPLELRRLWLIPLK